VDEIIRQKNAGQKDGGFFTKANEENEGLIV
jgi:hypothetical protein